LPDYPPRARDDVCQLFLRDEEVIEPRRRGVPETDPYPHLSTEAAARSIPLVVGEVRWIISAIDVEGAGNDPAALGRQLPEPSEEALRLPGPAEEAEVVPEHDDRVEAAERFVHLVEREQADVPDPSASAGLDGTRETSIPTTWRPRS
jgi:hypothetical protein